MLTIGGSVAADYQVDRQYLVIDGEGIVRWIGGQHELPVATIQEVIRTYLDALEAEEPPVGEIPQEFGIQAAYPNPFNGAVQLRVQTSPNQAARLRFYNGLGQLIGEQYIGGDAGGTKVIRWAPDALAAGRYYVILTQGASMDRMPLIYLK